MNKQRKVIDIFPPKRSSGSYRFPFDQGQRKEIKELNKFDSDKSNNFDSEELNNFDSEELKTKKKKSRRFRNFLFIIFLFSVGIIAFLHFVMASVNIDIWPQTETINLEEKVTVDASSHQLDPAASIIPGQILETEKSASQDFAASGKAAKESYAQGTIRVYNNYGSSQTLVQNTRFQPALDKVIYFRSVKTVVVPAKGYLDIQVKADRAGEEYNIEPATFSVPGLAGLPQYYSVYAKSSSEMTGGFKGSVSQVKADDLMQAQKNLSDKLKNDIKSYFSNQSDKDLVFLDQAMLQEILQASSSVPVGREAESFNFTLKIKTKVLAFKNSDLNDFVKELIGSKIQGTDKKIEEQNLKIDYAVDQADSALGKLILNVKISAKVYSDVNQESVKKALAGKSIKESEVLLQNQASIVRAQFNFFPPWLKIVPENGTRIKIKLNID